MSQENIVLSKKWGLNPTIPLCWYCDKQKKQIALLGRQGERLAKLLGHRDGQMPKMTPLPGDYTPCDECRAKGIGIVEVSDDDQHALTGHVWLVTHDAAKEVLPEKMWTRIEKSGYALVTEAVAKLLGLYQRITDEEKDGITQGNAATDKKGKENG